MAGNQEFDMQEANKMVFETVDKILGQENLFKAEKLKKWTDAVVQQVLQKLSKMKLSFKYTVSCFINQKGGAAMASCTSSWFSDADTTKEFRWENDAMICVVMISVISLEWAQCYKTPIY